MTAPDTLICLDQRQVERTQKLSDELSLAWVDGVDWEDTASALAARISQLSRADFALVMDASGLSLLQLVGPQHSIRVDFLSSTVSYRRQRGGGRQQMIAKACGLKAGVTPSVLDMTAGLGGDAFILAALGCELRLIERVPTVRALLADALERLQTCGDGELQVIARRMTLMGGDAIELANTQNRLAADVVYLDPMFPVRTKSAAVKKEMQVFHALVGPDDDADQLLDRALELARFRVVVKRPRNAPTLGSSAPSYVLEGKRNRYDIYTKTKMPLGLKPDGLNS